MGTDVVIQDSQQNSALTLQLRSLHLHVVNLMKTAIRTLKVDVRQHVIIGDQVNPASLGALLAHFENKVMFQGFLWNLDSFDGKVF